MDSEILNTGLDLAMAFGADWLKPIQERLARRYATLTKAELDRYDEICRAAMNFGHSEVERVVNSAGADAASYDAFERVVLARYPWINARNMTHLFSQGMYYALK